MHTNNESSEYVDQQIKKIDNRISEQIAGNMNSYGFPKSMGHIIASIYYEQKPMGLNELADSTGMSKTRMSQLLREMVQLNIAEKVFIKGSRRDTYTIEDNYYKTFISLFTSNWRDVVIRNRKIDQSILEEIKELEESASLNEEQQKKINHFLQDSKESIEFFDWVNRLIELFESEEIFKYVPKKNFSEE